MDCLTNLFISNVSRDVSCDVSCEASCDVVYVSYDVSLEDSGDDSRGIPNDAVNGAHSIARPTDARSVNVCAADV